MACMNRAIELIGADGMIDKTRHEAEAIKGARRYFGEALREHGMLEAFWNASPEVIDAIIEAAVTGFQETLKRNALNDDLDIPF
jgi:hypothetical protein